MARKKKKRSVLRDFSKVNIKLNIPWNDKGQGNKSISNNPNRGGGDVLDRESGAIVTKPKEVKLSSTQSNNRSDMVDSVSDFTTYEESDGGNEILLAPSSSTGGKTQSGNQVVKEKIVQISVDTSDPYEVLYRG